MSAAFGVRAWMLSRFWYGLPAQAARPSSTFASPSTTAISTAAKAVSEARRASRRLVISGAGKAALTTRLTTWRTGLTDVH